MRRAIHKWFKELGQVYTMTDWARDSQIIMIQQREANKKSIEILSLLTFK